MNLSKSEIINFLSLLLERNPITNIVSSTNSLTINHFDGKQVVLPLSVELNQIQNEIDYNDLVSYYETSEYDFVETEQTFDINDYSDLIEYYEQRDIIDPVLIVNHEIESIQEETLDEKFDLYFNDLAEKLTKYVESNQETIFNEHQKIFSTLDETDTLILNYIKEMSSKLTTLEEHSANQYTSKQYDDFVTSITSQIDFLKEHITETRELFETKKEINLSVPLPLSEELILNNILVEVKKDLMKFENVFEEKLASIKPEIIHNHHKTETLDISKEALVEVYSELKTTKETVANFKPDYAYIDTLFQTKIDNLKMELTGDDKKYITNFENKSNRLVITFSDNTFSDITDLILPLIRMNLENRTSGRSGGFGGGGYGAGRPGDPGFSAYQVAVNNGFIGTEIEWLETLKGGYVLPAPGTINRDIDGKIESIEIGDRLTEFVRDLSGNIIQIIKFDHTKTFIRDVSGQITGWTIS